jgi:hypothetical protein
METEPKSVSNARVGIHRILPFCKDNDVHPTCAAACPATTYEASDPDGHRRNLTSRQKDRPGAWTAQERFSGKGGNHCGSPQQPYFWGNLLRSMDPVPSATKVIFMKAARVTASKRAALQAVLEIAVRPCPLQHSETAQFPSRSKGRRHRSSCRLVNERIESTRSPPGGNGTHLASRTYDSEVRMMAAHGSLDATDVMGRPSYRSLGPDSETGF